MDIFYLLGIIGTVLIVFAFIMGQTGRWHNDDLHYDLVNILGFICLIISVLPAGLWHFVVLNGVLGFYSLHDVIMHFRHEPHRKHHVFKSKRVTVRK